MAYLIDTSILGRLANLADPCYALAESAVTELHQRGETLHLTAQNFIEFHCVATRPTAANGLGLSVAAALAKAVVFEATFPLLPDEPGVFHAWKSLVAASGVVGKQVHDARLVAICHTHGVLSILIFNTAHFAALSKVAPYVRVVHPTSV